MLAGTSRWSDLVLATYEVPEEVVRRHLPSPTLAADRWEGKTHATVVALHFGTVKVGGMGIPGSGDFPQVNLRIPVKLGDEAGLVFVRELVPNPLVASFARLLLRQPYQTLPLERTTSEDREGSGCSVEYTLDRPPRGWLGATGSEESVLPPRDSFEYHCMHRLSAFGTLAGRLARFPVSHPEWEVRQVLRSRVQLEHGAIFGGEWRFLDELKPVSLIFAVGSEVALHSPERL